MTPALQRAFGLRGWPRSCYSLDDDKEVLGFHLASRPDQQLRHAPGVRGIDGALHLHRLEGQQLGVGLHLVALSHEQAGDDARRGGPDMVRGLVLSAFRAAGRSACRDRSRTRTSRGYPFNSKKMIRVPSGCASPTVWNLTMRRLPGSMSNMHSSPSSKP